MAKQYSYADRCAVSGFTKETTYDVALTVNDTNFFTFPEIDGVAINYDDGRRDRVGEGNEFGSDADISKKSVTMSLSIPALRPNDIAFLTAFAMGTDAQTQDGAVTAYRHMHTRGSSLPSFNLLALEAGVQRLYTGCKINTLEIKRAGEFFAATAEIVGSGRRATNADSIPSQISEKPLLYGATNIWLESGADVNIGTPTQGSEAISAATPTDIKSRVVGEFVFRINNNLRLDQGYHATNSNDVYCRGQLGRGAQRTYEVEFPLTFEDAQEETDFLGTSGVQEHMAIELECNMNQLAVVAATGAFYWGFTVIIPRFNYDVIGASSDDDGVKTRQLKGVIKEPTAADESSTDPAIVYVYNAQAAYAG